MKKKYLTLIYLIINIAIIIVIGALDPHITDFPKIFAQIKVSWIMITLAATVGCWIMDGLLLKYSVGAIREHKSFLKYMKISIIGHYYHSVTPMATGGQPVQVYYMTKIGIPAGCASSAMAIKFLVYQAVLSVYSITAFILKGSFMIGYSKILFNASVVGLCISIGSVILVYSLSINEGIVKKMVFGMLKFLGKIRVIKDVEAARENIVHHIEDFSKSIRMVRGNYKALLLLVLFTVIQMTLNFSITYFVYRAFGLQQETWFNILFVQAFLYAGISYFPTPGASGASEGGFYSLFKLFFFSDVIFASLLLWRFFTYYINIIVGLIAIFLDGFKKMSKPTAINS
ncbi:MAG TPA: flippase-like domain-containing protein [Clostridiales bacterium]|nr:flippase-like domain-containing protein [Clostridiales bacterium]